MDQDGAEKSFGNAGERSMTLRLTASCVVGFARDSSISHGKVSL